ncbi:MAG: hypothetical protein ACRD1U_03530, partial [Vicinamibacterales bacterium]
MIGPRSVAALASLVLLAAAGCTSFYEIPIETPIQPKMDVTAFTRVLVAGFIGGGTDDVDANMETVRLLRSQLRSKSSLRVIEAEALPLADIAREQITKAGGESGQTLGGGPGASDPTASGPQAQNPAPVPQLPPAQGAEQQPPAQGAEQQPPAQGAEQQPPAQGAEPQPPVGNQEPLPAVAGLE